MSDDKVCSRCGKTVNEGNYQIKAKPTGIYYLCGRCYHAMQGMIKKADHKDGESLLK